GGTVETGTISATGLVDIDGSTVNMSAITAAGAVSVDGTELTLTDISSTGSSIALAGTTSIAAGILDANTSISLTGGTITLSGDAVADTTFTANGTVVDLQDIAATDVTLTGSTSIDVENITSTGAVDINGGTVETGTIAATGLVDVDGSAITLDDVTSSSTVSINGTALTLADIAGTHVELTSSGTITAGDITATGSDSVIIEGTIITLNDITSVGVINIEGTLLTLADLTSTASSINLESSSNITANNLTAGSDVDIEAGGIVTVDDITAGGSVDIDAGSLITFQNIDAGDNIMLSATALNTSSSDSHIKTTGTNSGIALLADNMFTDVNGTEVTLSEHVPSIIVQGGMVLFSRDSNNISNIKLSSSSLENYDAATLILLSELFGSVSSQTSTVPTIVVGNAANINVTARNLYLGATHGETNTPINLVINTGGAVDIEFTGAYLQETPHVQSTLAVDKFTLDNDITDEYGVDNGSSEALSVRILDATRVPMFNTLPELQPNYGRNFFSAAETLDLDKLSAVTTAGGQMADVLQTLAPNIANQENIDDINNASTSMYQSSNELAFAGIETMETIVYDFESDVLTNYVDYVQGIDNIIPVEYQIDINDNGTTSTPAVNTINNDNMPVNDETEEVEVQDESDNTYSDNEEMGTEDDTESDVQSEDSQDLEETDEDSDSIDNQDDNEDQDNSDDEDDEEDDNQNTSSININNKKISLISSILNFLR
ncbi:MAG: hypothetical protein V2B14_06940, partial [bacterium]